MKYEQISVECASVHVNTAHTHTKMLPTSVKRIQKRLTGRNKNRLTLQVFGNTTVQQDNKHKPHEGPHLSACHVSFPVQHSKMAELGNIAKNNNLIHKP